jgi:hypothetical protein
MQQINIRITPDRLAHIQEVYGSLDRLNASAVFDIGLDLVKELDNNVELSIINKVLMRSARRKLKI